MLYIHQTELVGPPAHTQACARASVEMGHTLDSSLFMPSVASSKEEGGPKDAPRGTVVIEESAEESMSTTTYAPSSSGGTSLLLLPRQYLMAALNLHVEGMESTRVRLDATNLSTGRPVHPHCCCKSCGTGMGSKQGNVGERWHGPPNTLAPFVRSSPVHKRKPKEALSNQGATHTIRPLESPQPHPSIDAFSPPDAPSASHLAHGLAIDPPSLAYASKRSVDRSTYVEMTRPMMCACCYRWCLFSGLGDL